VYERVPQARSRSMNTDDDVYVEETYLFSQETDINNGNEPVKTSISKIQ
jgi:hypothetical protein